MLKETHFGDTGPAHYYTCQPCQEWIDLNTQDWDPGDWESLLHGDIGGYRKSNF